MSQILNPMESIEAKRVAIGLSIEQLTGAAGVTSSYYRLLRQDSAQPRRAIIARLKAALSRLTGRPADLAAPEIRLVFYSYQMALALVCERAGVSTSTVHAQDPSRRATADKDWLAAAKLRRQAYYLLNCALGIDQADIAKATGMTPAAISLACRAIEQERDDDGFDQLMDELTRTITGDAE